MSTGPHSIVATYTSHPDAEAAVHALQRAGFEMRNVSLLGTHAPSEKRAIGLYNMDDRTRFWGSRGAFWGDLWAALFGGALFFLPAIGPVVVLGPLVGWIAGTLEGATVGGAAGVLGAALVGAGVPEDSVGTYETEVKAGRFLLLAQGTAGELGRVRAALGVGAADLAAHTP